MRREEGRGEGEVGKEVGREGWRKGGREAVDTKFISRFHIWGSRMRLLL